MKSFSSILSWLLLTAVLAVPSFLFYNWWSKGKQKASNEVSQAPVTANVFPSDPDAPPSLPPASRSAATGAGVQADAVEVPASPAAQENPAAGQASSQPSASPEARSAQPEEAGPILDRPEPSEAEDVQPEEPPAEEESGEEPAAEGGEQAVEASTVTAPISYFSPKGDRDPTLSPEDYRRIKEARLQREEAARMQRLAAQRTKKTFDPARLITLQGIIGQSAIVNGEMYTVGQRVKGIKIVKIGTNYIICDYKGKRFRKVMQ